MADTTARGGGRHLTSANAGLEEVILLNAVVSVGAVAPVRPLGEDAINGSLVDVTNDGELSSIGGVNNVIEVISRIVKESNVEAMEGVVAHTVIIVTHSGDEVSPEAGAVKEFLRIRVEGVRERAGRRNVLGPLTNITITEEVNLTDDVLPEQHAAVHVHYIVDNAENLDVVHGVVDEVISGGVNHDVVNLEGNEALLVRVGDVGNHEGIEVVLVTVEIEATATVALGRLATVLPILIEIAAELRLAGTVLAVGSVEAGVEVVDGGVALVVSETLTDRVVDRQAGRGRRSGIAAVGIVDEESTLEEGAVNALVLTA